MTISFFEYDSDGEEVHLLSIEESFVPPAGTAVSIATDPGPGRVEYWVERVTYDARPSADGLGRLRAKIYTRPKGDGSQ